MEHTKGKLKCHSLKIDIHHKGGDIDRLAEMDVTGTAYTPNLKIQEANARRLVKCWNGYDEGIDIIRHLLEAYCNMAQMIQTDQQFMGDQLTQRAEEAMPRPKRSNQWK